jgi:hypothetical protein
MAGAGEDGIHRPPRARQGKPCVALASEPSALAGRSRISRYRTTAAALDVVLPFPICCGLRAAVEDDWAKGSSRRIR